ncbi:type II toxin-antitoxin system RelE family toxin [Corynebacterium striatum]
MSANNPSYSVELTASARKQLKKMDRFDAKLLLTWMKTHLEGCAEPRAFGKGLTGDRSSEWRYRVGAYRILALIHESTITIEVFAVGRRDTIYR